MSWDGDNYQARIDKIAASGASMHGEADFVMSFEPDTVLDAGCGTGRVGIELAARGVHVMGADIDESMLATARARAPEIDWFHSDLSRLDLGRQFDVVVMAGNVPLFTPPGTEAALVAGVAPHVAGGGYLVAGFSLDRNYGIAAYDDHCAHAGLTLHQRYSTWSGDPFVGGDYAVSVHTTANQT